jgi:hypothetical protein
MKQTLLIITALMLVVGISNAQTYKGMRFNDDGSKSFETYKESKGKLKLVKKVSWYSNGQKESEDTYKDGKLIKRNEWDRDGNVIDQLTSSSQAQVDRTDAKSTAGAILKAYKAKDLRTLATLSHGFNHDMFVEMADSGKSHTRYNSMWSGWRWEGAQTWNEQIGEARYSQGRSRISASVKFGESESGSILVVKLEWEDGKWCFEDINSPSPENFLDWSLKKPKIPKDL